MGGVVGGLQRTHDIRNIMKFKKARQYSLTFHAFTGNDYNSAFFCKGKHACWMLLECNPEFFNTLCNFEVSSGEKFEVDLKEYVALLSGINDKSVIEARCTIFNSKLTKENKMVDMSKVSLCQQTRKLHILRSNFNAQEWNSAIKRSYEAGNIVDKGWTESLELTWPEKVMPGDVQELFLDNDCEGFPGDSDGRDSED